MVELVLIILGLIALLVGAVFLLGFRLGSNHWQSELAQVRLEAAQAERQLHDLTREAFVAMAERIEGRQRPER
jgi:Tfp pilus assembly protein PilX